MGIYLYVFCSAKPEVVDLTENKKQVYHVMNNYYT